MRLSKYIFFVLLILFSFFNLNNVNFGESKEGYIFGKIEYLVSEKQGYFKESVSGKIYKISLTTEEAIKKSKRKTKETALHFKQPIFYFSDEKMLFVDGILGN